MKGPGNEELSQAFQEEARETFVELEATLLELNEHSDDHELVQRAFRALHSLLLAGQVFALGFFEGLRGAGGRFDRHMQAAPAAARARWASWAADDR